MARILIATYMVRYPLGGMLSWALQYALGFHRLGHDVHLIERANYPDACFDPALGTSSDDGRSGYGLVSGLTARMGLANPFLFQSYVGETLGGSRIDVESLFRSADLLVDIGNHGAWLTEAELYGVPSVRIDGEPGFTQMKMEQENTKDLSFDYYFTNGANIGTKRSTAPNAGISWRHVYNPVDTTLFRPGPPPSEGCFTTVMNWQSHNPFAYKGKIYGQKDQEFARFIDLPLHVSVPLEVAVAGAAPEDKLKTSGWRLLDAHQVTRTFDTYCSYIADSLGEFSVCKNVFIETWSGWFSDRSAAYLACGRPVVLQDTGFSEHLPCGEGLLAVSTMEEAIGALDSIASDYPRHSQRAREIAEEFLDAEVLIARLLTELQ